MLRLRTFGSPAVERDGVTPSGASTQHKSLALLALIAAAEEKGVSRDKLLAYLWPETAPERASHRLNQVLYALRRDLETEDLLRGSSKLSLNPDVISSDLADFLVAHRAGDKERAVGLYGGPFLDGFNVRDAPEFDRWMDSQRRTLSRMCSQALESLAEASADAGDCRQAACWLRRLADHDPFSSRVTIKLMQSLAASGSRAEALEAARAYQQLMAEEMEAAPSPAVVALVERLRKPNPFSIAVLPLALLAGEPGLRDFADGLLEELMIALGGLRGVRVVARTSVGELLGQGLDVRELGRRLNVRALLEGSIRQAGSRVRVAATVVDVRDGCRIWSESFEQAFDDPFAAQEQLAKRILNGVQGALETLLAS